MAELEVGLGLDVTLAAVAIGQGEPEVAAQILSESHRRLEGFRANTRARLAMALVKSDPTGAVAASGHAGTGFRGPHVPLPHRVLAGAAALFALLGAVVISQRSPEPTRVSRPVAEASASISQAESTLQQASLTGDREDVVVAVVKVHGALLSLPRPVLGDRAVLGRVLALLSLERRLLALSADPALARRLLEQVNQLEVAVLRSSQQPAPPNGAASAPSPTPTPSQPTPPYRPIPAPSQDVEPSPGQPLPDRGQV